MSEHFCLDLKSFLQATPDMYLILDTNLIILEASEKFLQTTMVSRKQIVGKRVFDIFPDNPNDHTADGESKIKESFKRVIENKVCDTVGVLKYDIRNEKGEYEERYWSVINLPLLDEHGNVLYILNRSEDVTNYIHLTETDKEQKESITKMRTEAGRIEREILDRSEEIQQTNKRLREALYQLSKHEFLKSRLAAIVESSDDAIIGLLIDGTIDSWNKGAEKLYGYTSVEAIGQPLSLVYPPDKMDEYRKVVNHINNNKPMLLETERKHKNGSMIPVSLTISIIRDKNNRPIGACSIARDISEFKKVAQMKNEFISIVSHELRTPLTSIEGSLSLLLSGNAGELPLAATKLLQIGKQNSERLIRLINDILDIEKIESGKMEFHLEPLHADLLVREAILANEAFSKKFNITLKLIQKTNALIKVDHDRFLQVLTNLISNAIKFSYPGSEVTLCVYTEAGQVKVSINNKGQGIPFEFQSRVFEKFSQGRHTLNRTPGTGLGLSICKEIMEKLSGTISFVSEPSAETTFYLSLPIFTKQAAATNSFKKTKTVLLCENDAYTAEYLKTTLEKNDFKVIIAHNAAETKTILAEGIIDALLLDLILPDQNGITFIKDLRKHYSIAELPIVVISLMAEKGKKELNGNSISVLDWIEKPIDLTRFVETIKLLKKQIDIKTPKILHIEDDHDLAQIMGNLLQNDAQVFGAESIASAKQQLESSQFDLVILDLMLPDGSGVELLPLISRKHIPIIVFSAYDLPRNYNQFVVKSLLKSRASPHELLENIAASLPHKMAVKEF